MATAVTGTTKFRKAQPLGLRIWHWLNLCLIFGLMSTAFMRDWWFGVRDNADILIKHAADSNVTLAPEIARSAAIQIRDQMWDWHYRFGICMAFLFAFRIYLFFRHRSVKPKVNFKNKSRLHQNLVYISYSLFYIVLAYMVCSGLLMYFKQQIGLPKEFVGDIREIHETMLWFFAAFVVTHITGVVLAENQSDSGLISDMIHGGPKD